MEVFEAALAFENSDRRRITRGDDYRSATLPFREERQHDTVTLSLDLSVSMSICRMYNLISHPASSSRRRLRPAYCTTVGAKNAACLETVGEKESAKRAAPRGSAALASMPDILAAPQKHCRSLCILHPAARPLQPSDTPSLARLWHRDPMP